MKQAKVVLASVLVAGAAGLARAQAPAPVALPKTWADNVTVKGDLRYRNETIEDDSKLDADKDTYTRNRDRIRARLGAEAKVNDNIKAGIEMSTGQSDPVSGNQSLGDGFGKKEFRLNLAYFDYSFFLDAPYELHGIAGKMKNPFITFNDDLVWDPDLTPEGLAAKGRYGLGNLTLLANGGSFWAQERSDRDDLMLYAGQVAATYQFKPEVGLTVGASYYGFQDMAGYDVVDWENKNNAYGNSTVTGSISGSTTNKAWAEDFTPVVYFAQVEVWVLGRPLALYAQELTNPEASDYDAGRLYGASYGKARNPKTWEIGYSYAELEKDATPGMFTDSDRWGGGTDGEGHKVYGRYQIMKNLQAGVTYFKDDRKISDSASETDYERLQIDLSAAF